MLRKIRIFLGEICGIVVKTPVFEARSIKLEICDLNSGDSACVVTEGVLLAIWAGVQPF